MGVPRELRVVPAYVGLRAGNLLREQVRLVEEQYYGDTFKVDVVDDCVEDIESLFKAIRFSETRKGANNLLNTDMFLTVVIRNLLGSFAPQFS